MVNYFGIGEDGRIGYKFEQRRTKRALLNKAIYGITGFCYCLMPCKPRLVVSDMIKSITTADHKASHEEQEVYCTMKERDEKNKYVP